MQRNVTYVIKIICFENKVYNQLDSPYLKLTQNLRKIYAKIAYFSKLNQNLLNKPIANT